MLISENELLSIERELKESPSLNAFILKYHRVNHPEIRYMITEATWRQIKAELDHNIQINLLNQFIIQHRTYSDLRVKKLVVLSIERLLNISAHQLPDMAVNELCNEVLEICQSFNQSDAEIERVLVATYWRKAQQLETKDRFKANFFYNRMILICQNSTQVALIEYKYKAQISRAKLSFTHPEQIPDQIVDILSNMDSSDFSMEIGTLLLQLIYDYLASLKGLHKNLDLAKKVYAIEKIIEVKNFILLLNKFKDTDRVNDILHYLTFIFWLDNNTVKAQALVHQYFQNKSKDIDQVIDHNYKFQISDHLDIEAFNDFVQDQYVQFSQRQKYRKMFKVNDHRNIDFE